jgi:adenosylmethionine-8-amino-7-oxononanoate aminotransferase
MSYVFHRNARAALPVAVSGDGVYFTDAEGKRYLDGSSGAAVSCLGHSDPAVIAAIREQLDRFPFAHSSFFTSEPMEALAEHLITRAPAGLARVYFLSGGSEGVEAALKMARQYFLETGQPERRHVIARWQSYHGNTLGALAAGGNRWRRKPFEPLLIDVPHIAPCYAYRDQRVTETEEAYGLRVANELEETILRLGPETVACFIADTVVGATGGAVPPVSGYFRRIREICDRYGVLLVLDEVMCGMGRTGSLHACEQEGISPDLLVLAKGLGAGYQPIAALLVGQRIFDAIRDGSGFFQHGHTYMGHATACAAALAVQRAFEERDLIAQVGRQGKRLRTALEERLGNHHHVGDIRGRGLFLGVELVGDRASKEPFDPRRRVHQRVKQEALARGLMCYPMGGTIDGERGDHVLVAPPFIITDAQIDELVDKLGSAIDAATEGARAQ